MQEEDKPGQDAPDRAEEHRVGTPQNETQAPVEGAQADTAADAAPTSETTKTEHVEETRTESKPAEDAADGAEQHESS